MDAYSLQTKGTGGYLAEVMRGAWVLKMQGKYSQSQGLPADSIEVRQLLQFVVANVPSFPGLDHLLTKFLLNVGMLRKLLQESCHRVRRSVHPSINERPGREICQPKRSLSISLKTYDICAISSSSGSRSHSLAAILAFTAEARVVVSGPPYSLSPRIDLQSTLMMSLPSLTSCLSFSSPPVRADFFAW